MKRLFCPVLLVILLATFSFSQDRTILVPKQVPGAPYAVDDSDDLFGQAYRWFIEGAVEEGSGTLRKLVQKAGIKLNPNVYYVVVAHFTDSVNPIGIFHGEDEFLSTRLYGLSEKNLFYIFISREESAPSFLSVMATSKSSPFLENLPAFLGFFSSIASSSLAAQGAGEKTYIDVRQFTIPNVFRKNSDLSFIVKKDLSDDTMLAKTVFDNTSKERWSFGVATAITSVDDVDIIVGNDGRIIVDPKPNLDLGTFALVNFHFQPVDTKNKSLATSIHALGGLRLGQTLEPMIGIGGGIPLGDVIDLHLFAGYSLEFANELESGYSIGQQINSEVDPFKLKIRGKPRFGIEVKFP
jgi:hypothetical protein